MSKKIRRSALILSLATALFLMSWLPAGAQVQGVTGPVFDLTARTGRVLTSDGDSFLVWLFDAAGDQTRAQYPGPTLIVQEGQTVTVNLTNRLPVPTSIVFPGQKLTATSGDAQGLLAWEANPAGGTASYTFVADKPGTYYYHSGSRPDLQVEMGLLGAIVVRPAMGAQYAYNHADTFFDREFLLVLTEMDPLIHRMVEFGAPPYDDVDTSNYFATNWFANGRNFPDCLSDDYVPWLPYQPYKFQPRLHPGEKVLVRSIGGGVDQHPFHYHGNNFEVIADDGRMLASGPGTGPDLAWQATTRRSVPGHTTDIMWTWSARELGWDIYGHEPGDPLEPGEYAADHGKPFPVILPTRDSLTFGAFYPGTPFLGGNVDLQPGDPGLNATAGFFYMWHSHTEKELTSNDIWPGGTVTFAIVEHPSVPLP